VASFGEELRRERELREISLHEVAEATKIGRRYLEAMERNDLAALPGGVIDRGFVRAYCEYIGVDADSMINAYLLELQGRVPRPDSPEPALLRGPGRGRAVAPSPGPAGPAVPRAVRWAVIALLVAGLLAAVYLVLRFEVAGPPESGTSPPGPAVPAAAAEGGGVG
jgi:transcriptional regulator with XRE-family HTH domain